MVTLILHLSNNHSIECSQKIDKLKRKQKTINQFDVSKKKKAKAADNQFNLMFPKKKGGLKAFIY